MGKDREKGSGKWIAPLGGGGTDEGRASMDELVAEIDEAEHRRAKQPSKELIQRRTEARNILKNGLAWLKPLEDFERKILVKQIIAEFSGELSSRAKLLIRDMVETAADAIVDGDRAMGWAAAQEIADEVADGWEPEESEDTRDIQAIVDSIPR